MSQSRQVFKLWGVGEKPYHKENDLQEYEEEAWGIRTVHNITEPTLTVYPAREENTGKAVVIIPGGGYEFVALYHEGYDLAEVLANQGITAAVLKYRLPNPKTSDHPEWVPQTDARRALKLLREMADQFGIYKEWIGVLGFSAGSHIATVISLWENPEQQTRPDFSALIYGVTDFSGGHLNWISTSLYHRELTEDEVAKNQLLDLVSPKTPPAFLAHAYDDDTCPVKETTLYAQKCFENGVPVEVHLFPQGGHGFGLGRREDGTEQWVPLFINWLKLRT
jgi:acetyl esterase/lipase